MQITPAKLRAIASTSNLEMVSLRKSQPRIAAQNGAVLKMVYWTTRGTRATPKVIDVNPMVPVMHRKSSKALSEG